MRLGTLPVIHGVLERALVVRASGLWLLVRLMLALAVLFIEASFGLEVGHPLFLAPSAAALAAIVTMFLAWLVTRQRREDLMLANLGTSTWTVMGLMGVPPLMLEVAIAYVGSP